MTMQNQMHPDDERLAALAGGDPDASADAALAAHVSACDRCAPMVDELRALRASLAELPDLRPSRPMQLLPPVTTTAVSAAAPWWRRLAAPAMGIGAALVLVGAIGLSGVAENLTSGLASGAGQMPEMEGNGDAVASAAGEPAYVAESMGAGASGAPAPRTNGGETDKQTPEPVPPDGEPWLLVLAGGAVLAGGGLGLRSAARRREV